MFELSKRDSDIIKGMAIVLMFVHHFFCFPTWYVDGISYPKLTGFAEFFRFPTKICVSIFAFLTGYAYSKNNVGGGKRKLYIVLEK